MTQLLAGFQQYQMTGNAAFENQAKNRNLKFLDVTLLKQKTNPDLTSEQKEPWLLFLSSRHLTGTGTSSREQSLCRVPPTSDSKGIGAFFSAIYPQHSGVARGGQGRSGMFAGILGVG